MLNPISPFKPNKETESTSTRPQKPARSNDFKKIVEKREKPPSKEEEEISHVEDKEKEPSSVFDLSKSKKSKSQLSPQKKVKGQERSSDLSTKGVNKKEEGKLGEVVDEDSEFENLSAQEEMSSDVTSYNLNWAYGYFLVIIFIN